MSRQATKTVGEYKLFEVVGRGSFGQVFRAVNQITGEQVAIKMIPLAKLNFQPQLSEMLEKEFEALKLIGPTPRIIKLYKTFATATNRYIVYEFCDGGSLEKRLKSNGRIPEKEAVFLLKELVLALQDLTKHDILHRDIKTDNILFKDGQLKLGDFGLCKIGASNEETANLVGSPSFMAPESLESNIHNHKTEVYSIGVLFFEMLTGKYLFKENSVATLLVAKKDFKLAKKEEELEGLEEQTKWLLERMLEPKPEKRITIIEILTKLDTAIRPSVDAKVRHRYYGGSLCIQEREGKSGPENENQEVCLHLPEMGLEGLRDYSKVEGEYGTHLSVYPQTEYRVQEPKESEEVSLTSQFGQNENSHGFNFGSSPSHDYSQIDFMKTSPKYSEILDTMQVYLDNKPSSESQSFQMSHYPVTHDQQTLGSSEIYSPPLSSGLYEYSSFEGLSSRFRKMSLDQKGLDFKQPDLVLEGEKSTGFAGGETKRHPTIDFGGNGTYFLSEGKNWGIQDYFEKGLSPIQNKKPLNITSFGNSSTPDKSKKVFGNEFPKEEKNCEEQTNFNTMELQEMIRKCKEEFFNVGILQGLVYAQLQWQYSKCTALNLGSFRDSAFVEQIRMLVMDIILFQERAKMTLVGESDKLLDPGSYDFKQKLNEALEEVAMAVDSPFDCPKFEELLLISEFLFSLLNEESKKTLKGSFSVSQRERVLSLCHLLKTQSIFA